MSIFSNGYVIIKSNNIPIPRYSSSPCSKTSPSPKKSKISREEIVKIMKMPERYIVLNLSININRDEAN